MNLPDRKNGGTRGEQRRADIIRTATDLFASDGFHASSTQKIAAEAGVSETTLFNYFGTKQALLLAILDGFYEGLTESAQEAVQTTMDTRERLLVLANNHLRALLENNAIMMRLIQVYLSVDINYYLDYKKSHIHALNYHYTRIFDNVIREGIQRGYLDPELELPAIRDLFFGGLEYGMRTLLGKKDTRKVNSYVEKLVDPLWHSMQLDGGAPAVPVAADQRLDAACKRVEQAAARLEKAAGK